jgi:ABC-type multidrug transport system fused ATPase/permease subunit
VAIARAVYFKRLILLLDEPTSALDAESEQAVQQALARLQASHAVTIVIIAHRLSTVRHADHIVVLEDGRLLGSGTHDELMASAPWYRRIVRLQLGESAEGPAPRTAAGAT